MLLRIYVFIGCLGATLACRDDSVQQESVQDEVFTEYLSENHRPLTLTDNQIDFGVSEEVLEQSHIFLTGEIHGVAANAELNYAWLQYLVSHAGVRYYLAELPYSTGQLLNYYLASGNEATLNRVFQPLEETLSCTQENYAFWQKVYALNQGLPQNERVQAIGADIEHQTGSAIAYLATLLPESEAPENISGLMQLIRQVPSQSKGLYTSLISDLQASIASQADVYESYLDDNWLDFQLVVDNLAQRSFAYETREQAGQAAFNQVHDSLIYQNFAQVYPQLLPGKFYGQWEAIHISQHEQSGTRWFGAYLREFKDIQPLSVLSLLYLYQDCQRMERSGSATSFQMHPTEPPFHSLVSTPYTLFDLNQPASPFHEPLIWLSGLGTLPDKGNTTDFFQYALLIRGSAAASQLSL
ncbi:MAG: hypothetical protein WBA23_10560 [Tunicatimonas sp.]|uniref:hypothetical protein n=1 Tax=Tunicatimonas sp. TaxID=1940096 RepID=UPI003C745A9D